MSTALLENEAYEAFMKTPEKVKWWDLPGKQAARGSTLESRALQQIPGLNDFTSFESMSFGQRQHVLAKLRRLEEQVNIKALPAAVALLSAAIALIVAWNRETSSVSTPAPAVSTPIAAPVTTPAPAPSTTSIATPAPTTTAVPTPPGPSTQHHTPDAWAWILNLPYLPNLILPIVAVGLLVGAGFLLVQIRRHRSRESCLNAWIAAFVDSHALQTKIEEEGRKAEAEERKERKELARQAMANLTPSGSARLRMAQQAN